MRASQDEDRRGRGSSPQPFAVISKSRCQTAHLVPAAHFCVRGLQLCFTHPEQGVGGAPRNVRVLGGTPVRRIMTRYARRLARRLASHDAGRSPLGAPPWRFWASGPRFRLLRRPPPYNGGAVAFRIRAASSSQPGRSAWRATSRASRGERLQAARRRTPLPAPPSGCLRTTPLNERGCETCSTTAISSL